MSKKIVGLVTLGVSILVIILSITCCIYAAVALSPDRFKVKHTLDGFQSCLETIDYNCDDGSSFSCESSSNNETVCGLNPDCFCIGNSTIGLPMGDSRDAANVFNTIITVVSRLNLSAGILCIIGILPVFIGALGAILGVEVLEKTCGIIGIVFEACIGVLTTLILCAISYGIAGFLKIFGIVTDSMNTSNNPPPAPAHNSTALPSVDLGMYNTCPSQCKDSLHDLSHTFDGIARGCNISSNLAMAAVVFSIIALICTCVGFCMRKRMAASGSEQYEPSKKTNYGALR